MIIEFCNNNSIIPNLIYDSPSENDPDFDVFYYYEEDDYENNYSLSLIDS